jgi:IS5 family transposase
MMVRILFLQHLYNLSNPEMEDQLNDRLSFQRFVGASVEENLPSFSTIWRFKAALAKRELDDFIFSTIAQELDRKGLFIKKGTSVDATIIPSSTRPLSKERRKELEQNPSVQIDTDAKSTEKGGKKHFGYKGHIGRDMNSGLIRKAGLTPANVHDSQEFENVLSGDELAVYADKAYASREKKRLFRKKGIYWGVLDKAAKNAPLSKSQKKRNRKLSSARAYVEHPFAFIKTVLNMGKAVAKNFERNRLAFLMNCTLYNIFRAELLLAR